MKPRFISFQLSVYLVASALSALSQSTLYIDRGDFIIAAQAIPGHCQSIALDFFPSDELGPVLTISDVTFAGRYLLWKNDPFVSAAGPVLYNFDSGIPLGISFAGGARAFGADFSSLLSPEYSAFTATVSLSNGEVFSFTAPTNPDSRFFGFITPTPITHLTFSDGGLFGFGNLHEELIGNIVVVTVPEPGILGLFALGTLLLSWRLFRKRRQ